MPSPLIVATSGCEDVYVTLTLQVFVRVGKTFSAPEAASVRTGLDAYRYNNQIAGRQLNYAEGNYAYYYVHFILEVVCFFYLLKFYNNPIVWLVPFLYDAFAFVTQGLIGYINDKVQKIKSGIIGIILLFIGMHIFLLYRYN